MRFFNEPEVAPVELRCLPEVWQDRLEAAKAAYITRNVAAVVRTDPEVTISATGVPRVGDVILARVDEVREHDRIELPDGRQARLFEGDEIIVAYGARYATDCYEAVVPEDLGPCSLLTSGGMAGRVIASHSAVGLPTRISPVGLLVDRLGQVISTREFATIRPESVAPAQLPPVIAVVGTSMNAGKTTSAASLITGLIRSGRRVAAAKITGTGLGDDSWHLRDAGASPVFDFTDAGLPSTYRVPGEELVTTYFGVLTALSGASPDVIVVEIADGVAHDETAQLLADPAVRASLSGVIFAAGDALGAFAGVSLLKSWQLRVAAVTGTVTAAPLAVREASRMLEVPVVTTADLRQPAVAAALVGVGVQEAA